MDVEAARAEPADRRPSVAALAPRQPRSVTLIILAATAAGLLLRLFQLTRPSYLLGVTQYDDGVYLGDAVRLVHGALPYRDFVSDQPPGIMLLMAPVALLSKVTGTAWALAVARVLTACADAATIAAAGVLVRRRGAVATVAVCGILAVYPEAVGATYTLFLEPWLNLCCLIGAVVAFDGDGVAGSRKRLLWAGVALGFAGAIKTWAIVPVLVLLVLCLTGQPRPRRAGAFASGVAAGFLIPVIPFAAASPASFFNSVVVAQLSRVNAVRVPVWRRLASMTGLIHFPHAGPAAAFAFSAVIAAFIACALFRASIVTRRPVPALEIFALVTTAGVVLILLWPPQYFHHYASFLGPFLALAVALPAGRAARTGWPRRAGLAVAAAAICALVVLHVRAEAVLAPAFNPAPAAQRVIPRGACVLTDMASMTISADRFVAARPGCPLMVDSTGTDYVLSQGRNGLTGASRTAAAPRLWQTAFGQAQFVWLSATNRKWIPWTPSLRAYFDARFSLVRMPGAPKRLYVRRHPTAHPPLTTQHPRTYNTIPVTYNTVRSGSETSLIVGARRVRHL